MLDEAPQEAYKETVSGWIDKSLIVLRQYNLPKALWASILSSHLGCLNRANAGDVNEIYRLAQSLPEAPPVDPRAALLRASQDREPRWAQAESKRLSTDPQLAGSEVEEIVHKYAGAARKQCRTVENMINTLNGLTCSQPNDKYQPIFKERKNRVLALAKNTEDQRTLLVAGLRGRAREMLDIFVPDWKVAPVALLANKLKGLGNNWITYLEKYPQGDTRPAFSGRTPLPDAKPPPPVAPDYHRTTHHPPLNFKKFKKEQNRARSLLRRIKDFNDIANWRPLFQALVSKIHVYVEPQHRLEWLRWSFTGPALGHVQQEIPDFWSPDMQLAQLIWHLERIRVPEK